MGVALLNAWVTLHRHTKNGKDAPMRHQNQEGLMLIFSNLRYPTIESVVFRIWADIGHCVYTPIRLKYH
jgi:hypothetical protein